MFIKGVVVKMVAWTTSWSALLFPGVSGCPYKMNLFTFLGGSVCFFYNELGYIG